MAYVIYKTDGSLFLTLEDGQLDTANTSLTLVGKNVVNYGQYENSNLIRMLEHFASQNAPANPMTGQLWFDKTSGVNKLKVYSGTSWKLLPNLTISSTTPSLVNGDFWWDSDDQKLYVQSTSSAVLIGGNDVSVASAARLTTARNINGVPFSGTASITISAATPNTLTFGSFLTGNNFNGSAATTIAVDVGTVNQAVPNKVVARDNNGDIWFGVGYGTATASRYADLAEKYLADEEYEVGTVVTVGGSAEVTACYYGSRAVGVVSNKPGFIMNEDLPNGLCIALKGRVPTKIHGTVRKGQRLIAGLNGCAEAVTSAHPDTFAIALEDSEGKNIIEALIL